MQSWRRVSERVPRKKLSHFLCLVAAADESLTSKLVSIQDTIIEKHGLPKGIKVNVKDDLHITLMTLSLDSEEAENLVLDAVRRTKESGPSSLSIGMSGISNFGTRVMWARPAFPNQDEFLKMSAWRELVLESMRDLCCDSDRDWSPHATIMKTSKLRGEERDIAITEEMVMSGDALFRTSEHPPQEIREISLFSVKKDSEGRYIRRGTVMFPTVDREDRLDAL